MKYVRIILLLSIWQSISFNSIAQSKEYVVVEVSGVVKSFSKKPVLLGDRLPEGTNIFVGKNSSLLMACPTRGFIRIRQEGTCKISQTSCQESQGMARLFSSLWHYAWHDFTNNENHGSWHSHVENLAAVYRVTDGSNNEIFCNNRVDSNLWQINYSTGSFPLTWSAENKTGTQYVIVRERADWPEDVRMRVANSRCDIGSLVKKLERGKSYLWNVSNESEACKNYCVLHYVSVKTHDSMLASVASVVRNLFDDGGNCLLMQAMLLEKYGYLADAHVKYVEAQKSDPANWIFNSELHAFERKYRILE